MTKTISCQKLKPGQMGIICPQAELPEVYNDTLMIRCYDKVQCSGHGPVFQMIGRNDCWSGPEVDVRVIPLPLTTKIQVEGVEQ